MLYAPGRLLTPISGGVPPSLDLDFMAGSMPAGITFTRASAGWYFNSGGVLTSAATNAPRLDYDPVTLAPRGLLIEESRVNLLLQSEDFSSASYGKGETTVTANVINGPTGTLVADRLIESTTASAFHYVNQAVTKAASAAAYTFSVFLKDAGRQVIVTVEADGSNGASMRVNLATGAITGAAAAYGTFAAASGSLTAVGGGWYRAAITATTGTETTLRGSVALHTGSTNVYTGDGVSGAYLFGVQLEAGAFATSYIPTAASTVTRAADVASLPVPAVPTRTNLLLRSAEFDNAAWVAGGNGDAVVTANSGTAPDGTTTADTLNDNSATNALGKAQSVTITSGSGYYTASVYMKAATSSVVSLNISLSGGTTPVFGQAVINLATGAAQWRGSFAGFSFAVTDVGGGWYRAAVTVADNASGHTACGAEIRPAFAATYSPTINTSATGTVLAWGAQLETGSTASAYIPTTTAAGTVADTTSWLNATEGTLFAEFSPYKANRADIASQYPASFDDATTSNILAIYLDPAGTPSIFATAGGVTQAQQSIGASIASGVTSKAALAYKLNDTTGSANGAAPTVDTACTVPTVTKLSLGNRTDAARPFNGYIRRVRYYASRLPDAKLQVLTS
jgi:hypothetical protein